MYSSLCLSLYLIANPSSQVSAWEKHTHYSHGYMHTTQHIPHILVATLAELHMLCAHFDNITCCLVVRWTHFLLFNTIQPCYNNWQSILRKSATRCRHSFSIVHVHVCDHIHLCDLDLQKYLLSKPDRAILVHIMWPPANRITQNVSPDGALKHVKHTCGKTTQLVRHKNVKVTC